MTPAPVAPSSRTAINTKATVASVPPPVAAAAAPATGLRNSSGSSTTNAPAASSNNNTSLLKRHQALMSLAQGTFLSLEEEQALRDFHRFVRDDQFDEMNSGNWRVRMARSYYNKLFKEYAICDLSRYREADIIGLRWRTEKELICGKGQFSCGEKRCSMVDELHSYEVPFQ